MKDELVNKLEEFATNNEQLEEVFENSEQMAVSRYYENLTLVHNVTKELMDDEVYIQSIDEEDLSESEKNA